jgi:hypothetical protein
MVGGCKGTQVTMARSTDTVRGWRKVFLDAAEMVERHETFGSTAYSGDGCKHLPSCSAIREAGGDDECLHWYQNTLLDGETDVSVLWGDGQEYSPESYNGRVLLLCLAAAMTK